MSSINLEAPVTGSTSSDFNDPANASIGSYFILFPDSASTHPLNTTTPMFFKRSRSNVPSAWKLIVGKNYDAYLDIVIASWLSGSSPVEDAG